MKTAFEVAFANVIGIEKGYSNHKRDNGGETMWGITEATARKHGWTGSMKDMPLSFAMNIYKVDYWDEICADQLHPVIGEYLFDYAVNSGPGRAVKALQKAVGALPDGAVGPKTLALVGRTNLSHILRLVFVDRARLFAEHEDYDVFGSGWMARLYDVTERAVIRLGDKTLGER